jgi:hypothetical protein
VYPRRPRTEETATTSIPVTPLRYWLGKLLRAGGYEEPGPQAGRMDQAKNPYVYLEAVAEN